MEDKIPTPADVRNRLTVQWTDESEALLAKCINQIKAAQSTAITIALTRESQAVINRVIIALGKSGWTAEEDRGGDQRESWHNLKISPKAEPREYPR